MMESQEMKKPCLCESVTIQGFSHRLVEKECQDSSFSWSGECYSAICVCDGHGGSRYFRSAEGSKTACEVAREKIDDFMSAVLKAEIEFDSASTQEILSQLEGSIVSSWNERVEQDIVARPFAEDERFSLLEDADKQYLENSPIKAYGSTFICAVVAENFMFVLKLGDGNVAFVKKDGSVELSEELNSDGFDFNITESLCNYDALLSFGNCFVGDEKFGEIASIVLTSDGVINSFLSEDGYKNFISQVYAGYSEDDPQTAQEELAQALDEISEKGSGDDLSVALIIRADN